MLSVNNLSKRYGRFQALDGLSFHIDQGELHGFVGPNGAGKTTTMRILATLMMPSAGTATVDGVDVLKSPKKVRSLIGYMPDFFGVYDSLKTWEYLDMYARCYSFNRAERESMIGKLLELVRLSDKRDAYVDTLSRGMKQRLCLAHSLIHDPKLLILDEPASGMDPRARAEMKDILRTLRTLGKTILISSHILPELSEVCDSLTIIDRGNLVFSGTVDELDKRMNGNAPILVRIAPDRGEGEMNRAAKVLREHPGIGGIEQMDDLELKVDFPGSPSDASALLGAMMASGIQVCDFHRMPMNLEKVFMEVTSE